MVPCVKTGVEFSMLYVVCCMLNVVCCMFNVVTPKHFRCQEIFFLQT